MDKLKRHSGAGLPGLTEGLAVGPKSKGTGRVQDHSQVSGLKSGGWWCRFQSWGSPQRLGALCAFHLHVT